ncbi:MAG: Threonine dehydrogenase and related Zn-dependent dehydrogenases [uncultured Solirubrobacteraceae bacterium]|uniref:Threonine dehydrogenase and related Zn-dependent dehydrogenases n=1 Tax=uncultured Solirubrobacteraceae bacterium TaxID=1162706 RepID=A0A6J4S7S3_9ACTN|nr:MAG: Threonine dehydrogenase and related Zn-dependent dehydrogenases [uncultured Solirubrobacteraceae bacterium]
MKAVVHHGVGDIRVDDVPEPAIQAPFDAIVRLTASAICGTDLHFVRGTMPGTADGRILGHEGVGVVEEVGPEVRNLRRGDRVVVCSTISCGSCSYCRAGYFSQCDEANPNGPGTAFFGGPDAAGGYDGMQAEKVLVPFAHSTCVKLPDEVSDDQAILLSDIFPTGWFGADMAEIEAGDVVAVLGCGPVGQFAIASAFLMGAGRVLAVDQHPDRLETAKRLGAEAVDFSAEDAVEALQRLTGGIGPDRVIDAVGVEAESPEGPRPDEVAEVAQDGTADGERFQPGGAPAQALEWAVQAVAKAGTISIIGVYPPGMTSFPIGDAMNKNLTIKTGNCPHRRYIPHLVELVRTGAVDPTAIITEQDTMQGAIAAYEAFDARSPGWLKVELLPQGA